jgi:hypothetical protein
VQFNDPVAVAHYLDPAFGLSRASVAERLQELRNTALALRVPRRISVRSRTPTAASVAFRTGADRVTLRWVRGTAGWRLTGIGARSKRLAEAITNFLFFAQHPEVRVRQLRPGEDASLIADWLTVWHRVRSVAG